MTTSLSTLETMARQLADQENSTFVSQAELRRVLQDAYSELYDLLTSKNQDYYVNDPYEFTISGTSQTALPADFYKLLGVDHYTGGRWRELDPFNFNERNDTVFDVRYRTLGTNLHLTPTDECDGDYRLWYYPTCPDLETVGALDATANLWREFIVVTAAIYMLAKEESDTTVLERRKAVVTQRIEAAAASRDVGRSPRIQDVRRQRSRFGDDF